VSSLLHRRASWIEGLAVELEVCPDDVLKGHTEVMLQQIVAVVGVFGDDHQTLDDQNELRERERERERGGQQVMSSEDKRRRGGGG
jgi:hypothetical protein